MNVMEDIAIAFFHDSPTSTTRWHIFPLFGILHFEVRNVSLRVAERQADNIAELTKLVAAQASTAATQANTVATLVSRTG